MPPCLGVYPTETLSERVCDFTEVAVSESKIEVKHWIGEHICIVESFFVCYNNGLIADLLLEVWSCSGFYLLDYHTEFKFES